MACEVAAATGCDAAELLDIVWLDMGTHTHIGRCSRSKPAHSTKHFWWFPKVSDWNQGSHRSDGPRQMEGDRWIWRVGGELSSCRDGQ